MKGVFTCPDDMDPAAKDLLHGLMQKDVSKRIGRLANGADDMRNHEWYSKAGFDWVGRRLACLPACLPAAHSALCVAASHIADACALVMVAQPSLQSLEMEPPFIPAVGGDDDTSCFDVEADSDEEDPEEWREAARKPIDSADQGLFEGF